MATKKKAAKPAAKKVAPAKKAAPVKKAPAKPAAKAVAPAKKAAARPAAKSAPAKPAAKAAAKPAAKPAAKAPAKAVPAKAAPAKVAKPAAKPAVAAKAVKKEEPVKKAPEAKKPAPAKVAAKPVAPAKPAAAAKPASAPAAKAPKPEAPVKAEAPAKPAPAPAPEKASKKVPAKKIIRQGLKPMPPKPAVKDDSKQTTPIPIKKPAPPPEARPTKVVVPEIKTKTSQPYNPDFTKSVLDQNTTPAAGPTMRYSDAELAEFKDLINKKLDAAKKELAYLQGLITRKDEMGGDESESRYMTMEDGSVSMEREQLAQMASRQITFIDHLEKALMRIENKTYGICRVTGKLIDKARLRAVPHATLSIEAKNTMNK